jgi:hypothetical protein
MVNAEIETTNTAYGDAPIQRPTNLLLNSVIDGATRQNIQSRFEGIVKTWLNDYLNQLDGLTYNMIERIRDGDIELSKEVLDGFIMITDDDEQNNELVSIIGEYIYDIIGDDLQNPLEHIDNNIIDDIVIPFIQTTQSVILDQRTPYLNTDKTQIFIDYISSIMYWFGNPTLLTWCQNELLHRFMENHEEHTTDEEEDDE